MISFKIRLAKHRPSAGKYPVVIQILCCRRKRVLGTPYRIAAEAFDAQSGRVKACPESGLSETECRRINHSLQLSLRNLHRIASRLPEQGGKAGDGAAEVAAEYRRQQDSCRLGALLDMLAVELKAAGRYASAESHRALLSNIRNVFGNDSMNLGEIDREWVNTFATRLREKGLHENSVRLYLRVLKAAYRKALEQGLLPFDNLPFAGVSTAVLPTAKRALDREAVRRLAAVDTAGNEDLSRARDLFLFSFSSCGMPFVDMALLQAGNLGKDTLEYARRKTGVEVRVALTEPLRRIIGKYNPAQEGRTETQEPATTYLLPLLERKGEEATGREGDDSETQYRNYRNALRRYNRSLGQLAQKAGLCGKLTSHVARHSWATLALQNGIAIEVISQSLGHRTQATTRIYLDSFPVQALSAAHRKVIKKVLGPYAA